ncbi:zinc transporter [Psychromonas sp. psych-6C06]|uniref:zinc ABC transporter substrate-binding protein n=1 Tax=Psychromonas sp. psych-6C06 TaxID=2058089 RepID=UPI000C340A7C|nr:zinc ABC transporter substrate-binding protein [Psychromonas sp. psych-6C06]PKF62024.1 zinc transporter [Psychromonas sp. psych-6C06]
MFRKTISVIIIGLAMTVQVHAQVPKVVVDIAPLHSLVTQVMDGVGEPALLIRPEDSPHEYHLRPSGAKVLSQANIVFWIGEGLTPWLEKSLSSLANDATKIEMMTVAGTTLHNFREGATFEAHPHHDEEIHEHQEADHHSYDEKHDKHHGDKHEINDEAHAHHHEGFDPHVWLDPKNAEVWLKMIAKTLSHADSKNAPIYEKNATEAINRLHALTDEIEQKAQSLKGIKFIVFHDAYQYFEQRFQLLTTGAISVSDAAKPSPSRVSEIRQTVKELGVTCVFTEPQYNPELVNSVFENTTVATIGTMDPLGADITVGKDQYSLLLQAMINSLQQCQS